MQGTPLTRRQVLAGMGGVSASSIAGCVGSSPSDELAEVSGPESFVKRDGPNFVIDGESFVYNGAQAGFTTRGIPFLHDHTDWIDEALEFLSAHNVSVIRAWGYPETFWTPRTHPEPGTFDDTWFEKIFDYTIAKAKEQGIRLVIPLVQGVHFQPDAPPSTAAYADWSDTANHMSEFFDDEQANQYYKNYIEHVLTRENSITGVAYREDPTIMMWECGNEAGYHEEGHRGESLAFWYNDIASYIKSIDENHLVGTGMHGSMGEVYEDWTWRNEYVDEHRSEAIDACSFHAYPVSPIDDGEAQVRDLDELGEYIRHKVRLAHEELNKPAYLGEIGTHYMPEYDLLLDTRAKYFEHAGKVGLEAGLNGIHFWRLVQFDQGNFDRRKAGEGKFTEGSIEDDVVWEVVKENGERMERASSTT